MARRETPRHPQLKILQIWKLRRCRCCRAFEPVNQDVTVSTRRPGSDPVNLTLLISTVAIMLDIASASELPHVRIRASEPGPLIDVPELLRFPDLLWILADRDLRVRYKQTALGVTRSWYPPGASLDVGLIPIPFNGSCQQRKPPASMSLPQLYSWQGGYGDRYRQGSQRVRVLAHSRASPRSETYHPSRTGGRGPGPYRPRSLLLLPIVGMVHGLVCHRSGPVLLRLLPPDLPLAATVSPRPNPRAIYLLRGAQTSRHRPAAVLGQSGHRLQGRVEPAVGEAGSQA